MKIAIGSDHAGYPLKVFLSKHLSSADSALQIIDVGTDSPMQIDYPPFCIKVAELVAEGSVDWGIVLGGSGQGEMIAANKVVGVRAALCNTPYFARLARRDNNANVIAIGARVVAPEFAVEILAEWADVEFSGGRHARRIELISDYERQRVYR